jgi:hypothetical protein
MEIMEGSSHSRSSFSSASALEGRQRRSSQSSSLSPHPQRESCSSSNSTIRISTPTLDPADEQIVENWIQQSLAMPSAHGDDDAYYGNGSSDDGSIDVNGSASTTNLHRRERSLDDDIYSNSGIYDSTTTSPPPPSSNPSIATHSNIYNTPSIIGSFNDNENDNNNNSNHNNIAASYPFFKPDIRADWGSDSCMFNGDDSILVGGSTRSSLIFNASMPGTTMATTTDNNNNQHPLKVSRSVGQLSKSPVREEGGGGGGGNNSSSTSSSGVKGISSVIHDAARITDWQTVVELCQQQPKNAAFTGRDGWTALHHACNRRCPYPNVVESLIRAYPDALLMTEEKGWLPLHYACRFKAPKEVVRLLLQIYPGKGRVGVSRPDRKGRSPLYYAVRYDAPSGVVGLLLEVDASAVLEEDQNADSPLALVWDDWAEKLDGKRTIQKILDGTDVINNNNNNNHQDNNNMMNNSLGIFFDMSTINNTDNIDDATKIDLFEKSKMVRKRLESQTKVFDRWNKVNVFLKAAFGFSLDEDWEFVTAATAADNSYYSEEKKRDNERSQQQCPSTEHRWRILHAISAIKCHYSLFLLAISLHPEQAFELDRNNLRRIDNIYKSNTKGGCSSKSKPSNLTALHLATSSQNGGDSGKMVLTQLLALNPGAAESVDTEGSTPLHRISENNLKSDWNINGVEEVYRANTNAIRTVDINGRLPLHRASSSIRNYDNNIEDEVILLKSVLCRLLQHHDEAARCSDYFGCLPLHLVAQHGKRWDVQVQALYDANTAAVRARTGVKLFNRLPIHLATANINSDFSLISKLVEYNPRGTSQADRKGFLPLHLACVSGLSWKSIQSIHEAFPEAVRQAEQNRRGWNALHMAASSECSDDELISNLVQLYPEATSVHDSDDRYPLHLACLSGKDWDGGVSSLFEANADAIRCRDKGGLLPLHIVALRYRTKSDGDGYDACDDDDSSRPKVTDIIRSRRLSKSGLALEADQLTAKETKEAKELSNIFELLKADPTVLL